MKDRKITGYDLQIADIQLTRTLCDCIIELESIKDNTEKQLLIYKQKYGEL